MSCQNCTPQKTCGCDLKFEIDGAYLAPYVGGTPLTPVDLAPLVEDSETDTQFQLDQANAALVYRGEKSQHGGTPDTITIQSIAALIGLADLKDVEFQVSNNGDLLIYDSITGNWIPYTIPEGTIVSTLGIDADGKPVKSLASAPLPGSVEIPIGGYLFFSGPEADLPSNFFAANGQAINRSIYPDYFALVGTTYGPGNGATTFNIPNANGRTLMGMDVAQSEFDTLGKTGGAKSVTLNTNQIPPHSHGVNDPGHTHPNVRDIAQTYGGNQRLQINGGGQAFTFGGNPMGAAGTGIYLSNTGGGGSHENLVPYLSQIVAVRVQ